MAVPTQLSDLSATAASNSPAGTDTVGTTMDDFLRAHASIIARISAGTDALATPNVGAATGTSIALGGGTALTTTNRTGTGNLVLATSPTIVTPTLSGNTTVSGGTFATRGLTDSATATALTLSGSGANSITIANSATTPTLGTTGGALLIAPATGFMQLNGVTSAGLLLNAATGSVSLCAFYVNGTEVGRVSAAAANAVNIGTSSAGTHQVSITHTASADRYITLTGANAANPKISTSAGSLDIGAPIVFTGQTVGTTVGAAGGASALPATPLGYLTTAINGTACKVPYYTA